MTRLRSVALTTFIAACAPAAVKPAVDTTSTTSMTSAAVTTDDGKTAAEKWAEAKMAKEAAVAKSAPRGGLDPLSEGGALEASMIPKVELTPKSELRGKSRHDLEAAVALVSTASTVDEAQKKLVARLGKPTWIENGQKRVWVAAEGARCHRLAFEPDGSVSVETANRTDWTMLSALAKQNLCTGEIKRGAPGSD